MSERCYTPDGVLCFSWDFTDPVDHPGDLNPRDYLAGGPVRYRVDVADSPSVVNGKSAPPVSPLEGIATWVPPTDAEPGVALVVDDAGALLFRAEVPNA